MKGSGVPLKIGLAVLVVLLITANVWLLLPATSTRECLLESLPGTDDDQIAHAKYRLCKEEHGKLEPDLDLSMAHRDECFIEHADGTRSKVAQSMIARACQSL